MGVNYAKKRFMKLRPGELTGWRCTAPRPCRRPTNDRVVKSRNKLERLQLYLITPNAPGTWEHIHSSSFS